MRKPIPDYLKPNLNLHYSRAVCILHEVIVGANDRVLVIGDPDNDCYEYLIDENGGAKVIYSDCGYGESTIALRDGLIVYHGLPDREPIAHAVNVK